MSSLASPEYKDLLRDKLFTFGSLAQTLAVAARFFRLYPLIRDKFERLLLQEEHVEETATAAARDFILDRVWESVETTRGSVVRKIDYFSSTMDLVRIILEQRNGKNVTTWREFELKDYQAADIRPSKICTNLARSLESTYCLSLQPALETLDDETATKRLFLRVVVVSMTEAETRLLQLSPTLLVYYPGKSRFYSDQTFPDPVVCKALCQSLKCSGYALTGRSGPNLEQLRSDGSAFGGVVEDPLHADMVSRWRYTLQMMERMEMMVRIKRPPPKQEPKQQQQQSWPEENESVGPSQIEDNDEEKDEVVEAMPQVVTEEEDPLLLLLLPPPEELGDTTYEVIPICSGAPLKFVCDSCAYQTNVRQHMRSHVDAVHLKRKDYECERCEFRTGYSHHLKSHFNTVHLKKKMFRCEQCQYRTNYKQHLKSHTNAMHTKMKVYYCEQCDYQSSYSSHMKAHLEAMHLNGKRHACNRCQFKTNYKHYLKSHIDSVHLNWRRFACQQCEYKTNYKYKLTHHVKTVHARWHRCEQCEYGTNYRKDLKTHIAVEHHNTFKCGFCDFKTHHNHSLRRHVDGKHLKLKGLICQFCEFRTGYGSSMERHVDVKHSDLRDAAIVATVERIRGKSPRPVVKQQQQQQWEGRKRRRRRGRCELPYVTEEPERKFEPRDCILDEEDAD